MRKTRENAFTLAEVLITLGIIGVVAAMTIPNLIQANKAHVLSARFVQTYSILQQAFKQMEADDVSLNPADYGTGKFYKTFMNYLQAPFDCGLGGSMGQLSGNKLSKPCYLNLSNDKDSDKPYKTLDGKTNASRSILDDGQIALQNGTLLLFENAAADSGYIIISADLNGYNNPPNRLGYDLFTFQFIDGELITIGAKNSRYPNTEQYCSIKGSGSNINGITCAQKAKENPNEYFKYIVKKAK